MHSMGLTQPGAGGTASGKTFRQQVDAYIAEFDGIYSKTVMAELPRRYRRLVNDLTALQALGQVRCTDFSDVTEDDVKAYAKVLRNRSLAPKTVSHYLTYLSNICKFYGNWAVTRSKARYPILFYRPAEDILPPLSKSKYDRLMEILTTPSDGYLLARAKACIALALGAGLRPCELEKLTVKAIDLDDATVSLTITKGQGTYAHPRRTPILPPFVPVVARYLDFKRFEPPTVALSPFLFPNPVTGHCVVTNTLRTGKDKVAEMAGFAFDFRICRRTYVQNVIDLGVRIEAVSKVVGHSSTKTTEGAYGRIRESVAIREVSEAADGADLGAHL